MLSIDEIRKLAIIALFSDDDLMDTLVLKGGNALTFAYNVSNRASIDVDVSMGQHTLSELVEIALNSRADVLKNLMTT